MMPADCASHATLQARQQATVDMRTLTHWVNKAANLGEERPEQVALEQRRVAVINIWEQLQQKKVLLKWDDLSNDQRILVVGEKLLNELSQYSCSLFDSLAQHDACVEPFR
jgi:hypothetical protein